MSKVQKSNVTLVSVKNGKQVAEIGGQNYEFRFTESDLSESIEMNDSGYGLSHRSGLDLDDYNVTEMAQILAEDWDDADVILMIEQIPASELVEFIVESEVSHAA